MISRRNLIGGLGSLFLAAPAIVRASTLMPVSSKNIDKCLFWVDGSTHPRANAYGDIPWNYVMNVGPNDLESFQFGQKLEAHDEATLLEYGRKKWGENPHVFLRGAPVTPR